MRIEALTDADDVASRCGVHRGGGARRRHHTWVSPPITVDAA